MKVILFGIILLIFIMVPQADALRNDKAEAVWFWDKETVDVTLVTAYTFDQLEKITKAVTSEEFFSIEDNLMHKDRPGIYSPYYLGWQGALNNANATTPQLNFNVGTGGDVIISLVTRQHPEGFIGFTQPVFDRDGKISKVYITIYDVDKLSNAMLYTIVFHEMGHALGLGHTTASEELMHPVITTPYPYVAPCTMQALNYAYQGNVGKITCEK